MSKINIPDLPLIQSVENKPVHYRGGTNSADFNAFQETAYFDVTNLYNVINEMQMSFQDMSMAHSIESVFTQMKVGDLPAIIEQLQNELDGMRYDKHRKVIIHPSKTSNVLGSKDGADINVEYGQINIPYHSSTSKLYLYDEAIDMITIPSSLIHEVTPHANSTTIVDNDFLRCVTGYENEYFIRRVESDSTTPVEMTVEILLPDNIISNRDVNTIYLAPYPYAALDVLSMEYQADAEWRPVPGFTSHKLYKEGCIVDAENIKLCFDKIQINKIRIKFRQRKYIVEAGKNIFYLGLKYFSVNFEMVKRQFCTFMTDIDFKTNRNKTIYSITPKLNNNSILSDTSGEKKTLFSFEVYAVNEVGEKRYIKNTLPFTFKDSRLLVITNMYYDSVNDINPSLYRLELEYDVDGDGAGNGSGGGGEGGGSHDDCKCILSNMVFNDDSIIVGADETSKPYKLSAAAMLEGECEVPGHIDKNIKYNYTIKSYGAGARISGDTLIVNSTGVVVITATARLGSAMISKDATIVVEKIKKYTLTYLSTNGGYLNGKKIQNIEHGNDAETVEAINEVGYHFVQWSDGNANASRTDTFITSSAIHTAQFDINKYTVTYLDNDGNVISTEEVKHGFPATPPTAPEVVDYLFTGWNQPLDSITADVTTQAQYTIKTFVVTFTDWNDSVIDTQTVIIHHDAVKPTDPTKDGHTFTGWSENTDAVTRDITSKAQYDINTFTVTFLNWDGTLLSTQTIDWMTDAVPPTATKEGWHFIGWDGSHEAITEDKTLTAEFAINVYTVKFVDHNNQVVATRNVEHGSDATAPTPPDRTGYDFTGWDKSFTNVTSNLIVQALYTIKRLTVTISKVGDGTVSPSTQVVDYGQSVTVNFSPSASHNFADIRINGKVAATSGSSYTIQSITENKNVVVTFSIKTFTITWCTHNGGAIRRDTVNYGSSIADVAAPQHPIRDGYNPDGWTPQPLDVNMFNIVQSFTMTARYTIKTFTVTPTSTGNGTINPSTPQTVEWGSYKRFTFSTPYGYYASDVKVNGVSVANNVGEYSVMNVREDKALHVTFSPIRWRVVFKHNGVVIKEEYVETGKAATPPPEPTKDGYVFRLWSGPDINNIRADSEFNSWFYKDFALSGGRFKDNILMVHTRPIIIGDNQPFSDTFLDPYYVYNNEDQKDPFASMPRYNVIVKFDSYELSKNSYTITTANENIAKAVFRKLHTANGVPAAGYDSAASWFIEGITPGDTTATISYVADNGRTYTKTFTIHVEDIVPNIRPVEFLLPPVSNNTRAWCGDFTKFLLSWGEKQYYDSPLTNHIAHTVDGPLEGDNTQDFTFKPFTYRQYVPKEWMSFDGQDGYLTKTGYINPTTAALYTVVSGTETIRLTISKNTIALPSGYSVNSRYEGIQCSHTLNILDGSVKTNIGYSRVTSKTQVSFLARCKINQNFISYGTNLFELCNIKPPIPGCSYPNGRDKGLCWKKFSNAAWIVAVTDNNQVVGIPESDFGKFVEYSTSTIEYSYSVKPVPAGYKAYFVHSSPGSQCGTFQIQYRKHIVGVKK